MNHDSQIKLQAMRLLWALGYVVRPEVVLSERRNPRASRGVFLDITDVDVMGYRFDPLLSFEVISVDCGSGGRRSGMDRAFWCAGMMEATKARRVLCVVGKEVEEEHRRAALRLGVILSSLSDFQDLSGRILGRENLRDFTAYLDGTNEWLKLLSMTDDNLSFYLARDNYARDWPRVPVQLPTLLRRWQVNVDLSKPLHRFGLMECAVMVAISIVMMSNHMLITRPRDLRNAVRDYVLGGRQRTAMLDRMAKKVNALDILGNQTPPLFDEMSQGLEVPGLDNLLDITDRFMKKPIAAQQIPRYLQAIQLAHISGDTSTYREWLDGEADLLTEKFAVDVLDYLARASDTRGTIFDIFNP